MLQPTLTRVWSDGWFAGLGDFAWTVDWKNDDVTLPVSLQAGRVFRIGSQLVSLSYEAGVVALHPDDVVSPSWVASAQLAFLFPEVIRKRRIGKGDETREGASSAAQ